MRVLALAVCGVVFSVFGIIALFKVKFRDPRFSIGFRVVLSLIVAVIGGYSLWFLYVFSLFMFSY